MKISYRTHPVLERIENGKLGTIAYGELDESELFINKEYISEAFQVLVKTKPRIYKLSEPFIDAYNSACNKIKNSSLLYDIDNQSIIFIYRNNTIVLKIENDRQEGKIYVDAIKLVSNHENVGVVFCGDIILKYDNEKNDDGKLKASDFSGFISRYSDSDPIEQIYVRILITLFIRYAKVEIKYLPAGGKIKDINCKYKNETNSNITILDSKWFTTLVKSDGFKVRGHFRLQPKKKDGEWTKELIWINDFEKTGYTAPARKISQVHE